MSAFDYDAVIVGSGFDGSVAVLRGKRVAELQGRAVLKGQAR